jgi:hypothetical protein
MADEFQAHPTQGRSFKLEVDQLPLPAWLARRLLRSGEHITFARGPKQSPWWERYVTHPAFLLLGVVLCVFWGLALGPIDDSWIALKNSAPFVMLMIMVANLLALGIACGHFTRLVVTNRRLFIVQGYEIRRGWELHNLPRSLLHLSLDTRPTLNLDALKSMLGPSSENVAGSKAILAFGKHLDAIKTREKDGR